MSRFNGARARELRLNTGLGVEELALAAGVSPNTVRHAESGVHEPCPRVAAALARALGVTTADLATTGVSMTLGEIRHRLGLTQKEIARRLNKARQMVSRVERGLCGVSAPQAWAAAYEVTADQWNRAYQTARQATLERVAERTKARPTGGT